MIHNDKPCSRPFLWMETVYHKSSGRKPPNLKRLHIAVHSRLGNNMCSGSVMKKPFPGSIPAKNQPEVKAFWWTSSTEILQDLWGMNVVCWLFDAIQAPSSKKGQKRCYWNLMNRVWIASLWQGFSTLMYTPFFQWGSWRAVILLLWFVAGATVATHRPNCWGSLAVTKSWCSGRVKPWV